MLRNKGAISYPVSLPSAEMHTLRCMHHTQLHADAFQWHNVHMTLAILVKKEESGGVCSGKCIIYTYHVNTDIGMYDT